MNWHCKFFDTLSTAELYSLLQLRSRIFVVEQNCPYQDLDDKDQAALHLWCNDEQGLAVAYCRILPAGASYPEVSIGRVANDTAIRGKGIGRQLMQEALDSIRKHWGAVPVRISAQEYLQRFYESMGFEPVGAAYLEDNIPHIEMLLRAK
ncbi:GNAT family N-acetyltransferase [Taibaiella koreensis]|uniref:GNAT family N-acetyltransferase n=1 Tax=Taibaiella koreensis TaxID=1268548 RepID=UPI000E59CD55|nr:GNAT family N-acetyltransferase [Taibaiella koreensis]